MSCCRPPQAGPNGVANNPGERLSANIAPMSGRHDPLPVFDGHNDAMTRKDHAGFVEGRAGGHLDLPRMRDGGLRGGIFSVFTPSGGESLAELVRNGERIEFACADAVSHETAAAHATAVAGRMLALERAGHLRLARTIADVDDAGGGEGPPVAVLHLEGAEAIDPRLEALEAWHAMGLRSIGPVWSRRNAFAEGVPFIDRCTPDLGGGLTDAGRALVGRCAELGVLVDLSHLNAAGFWDVARLEPGPLVASHSGAHALAPTTRNLTDDQLDAIGSSGGLVGIVFACRFLRSDLADDANTPLRLIVEHARYVADRIGIAHVAFGSDFDGATVPAELADVAGLPRLLAALADDGFTPADVEAIAWHNWRRVLAAWWR
jgi:membrane dipeptidase